MSIFDAYKKAWFTAIAHWQIVLLIWFVNVMLAFMLLNPLKVWLIDVFGNSSLQEGLLEGFDFTLFSEILRQNDLGLSVFISQLFLFLIPYFLWSVFCAGGIMGILSFQGAGFWKAGAKYFWRFLRLSIYLLFSVLLFIGIMLTVLNVTGINLFELENEMILIKKLKIFLVCFLLFGFFFGLFRDLAKIEIWSNKPTLIFRANLQAFKNSFRVNNMLTALFNILFLVLMVALYLLLQKTIGTHWLIALALSQFLLILRILYRFIRIASLFHVRHPLV